MNDGYKIASQKKAKALANLVQATKSKQKADHLDVSFTMEPYLTLFFQRMPMKIILKTLAPILMIL